MKIIVLILSPAKCEIHAVIRSGELTRKFWNSKRPFLQKTNACRKFSISSGVTRDGRPLRSSSCTLVRSWVNCPHHCLTMLLLIMSGPYTWHNWRWISVVDCFWACRNLITARISPLVGDNQCYQLSGFSAKFNGFCYAIAEKISIQRTADFLTDLHNCVDGF